MLEDVWLFLKKLVENEKVPQSLIFLGSPQSEKSALAMRFAALLNCLRSESKPCGRCLSCRLLETDRNPDIKTIKWSPDSSIGIGEIREMKQELSLMPRLFRRKVIILENADRLNIYAQSALLKLLEEPCESSVVILISEHRAALLPTIHSRCQVIKFPSPASGILEKDFLEMERFFNFNLGEKLLFLQKEFGKQASAEDIIMFLNKLESFLRQILLEKIGVRRAGKRGVELLEQPLKELSRALDLLAEKRNIILFSNVNPRLAAESLVLEI